MQSQRPRRIVTGLDHSGNSRVLSDGASPAHFLMPDSSFDVIWRSETPLRLRDSSDPDGLDIYTMRPPPGSVTWVILDVPPESAGPLRDARSPEVVESLGRFDNAGVFDADGSGWHQTPSLDFVTVVEGEIDLELDDGVHHLRPGDCVVQTGTRHRWINRGDVPCRLSGVIIGAAAGYDSSQQEPTPSGGQ